MSKIVRKSVSTAALGFALIVSACGDATEVREVGENTTTTSPIATAANNSFISLAGRVLTAGPNSFTMDYGRGSITVEVDDWDWHAEGSAIKAGDNVSVTGLVDNDLWERRSIEASSVYVRNTNSFFYANSADEEGGVLSQVYLPLPDTGGNATGYVTGIEGREFTIGVGDSAVRVDTAQMRDNPLDLVGTPKVRVGDRVFAYGTLQIDPNERAEIMASAVVRLLGTRQQPRTTASPATATPAPVSSAPDPAPSSSPAGDQSTASPS